ncbi:MAG: iron-containing redox enzyme family protein [Deltaproteobacteria bacterium]|nr:iron-containing redox enzyme family protein [Deltaproteobacteria bacterium]
MERILAIRKRVYEELGTTRIIRMTLDDALDLDVYRRYLANARYYAQFSPVVMALGGSRCIREHPELGLYLIHHAEEEAGHDRWALEDLRDLGVGEAEALAMEPVNACRALVGYVHFLAGHANSIGLFGWMYILEAVGEDFGSIAGQRLLDQLGDAASAVRFVAGHGEADAEHTPEIAAKIESHVRDADDLSAVAEAASVVKDLYLRMFREIGGESQQWA